MELLKLFLIFAKIGSVSFGGGYAMLPLLEKELVEKHKYTTKEELLDYYAIGQCTPGIIAVNTATFIGYKYKKVPGAIAATLGIVFPSLIIIMLIATFLSNFADYPLVQKAFNGIRVCVGALILVAVMNLWKKSIVDKFTLLLFIIMFIITLFLDPSPILIILLAALIGLIKKGGVSK